jgi:hypothetical protein
MFCHQNQKLFKHAIDEPMLRASDPFEILSPGLQSKWKSLAGNERSMAARRLQGKQLLQLHRVSPRIPQQHPTAHCGARPASEAKSKIEAT